MEEPFELNTGGAAVVLTSAGIDDVTRRDDGLLVAEPEHGNPGIYGPFANEAEAIAEARAVLKEAHKHGVALTLLVMEFYGNGKWGYAGADVAGDRAQLYTKDETLARITQSETAARPEDRDGGHHS